MAYVSPTSVATGIATKTSWANTVKNDLDDLNSRVSSNNSRISSNDSDISSLQSQVGAIGVSIKGAQTAIYTPPNIKSRTTISTMYYSYGAGVIFAKLLNPGGPAGCHESKVDIILNIDISSRKYWTRITYKNYSSCSFGHPVYTSEVRNNVSFSSGADVSLIQNCGLF
jgi:hypothetical protein